LSNSKWIRVILKALMGIIMKKNFEHTFCVEHCTLEKLMEKACKSDNLNEMGSCISTDLCKIAYAFLNLDRSLSWYF
jgi:hypothetical protein